MELKEPFVATFSQKKRDCRVKAGIPNHFSEINIKHQSKNDQPGMKISVKKQFIVGIWQQQPFQYLLQKVQFWETFILLKLKGIRFDVNLVRFDLNLNFV